MLHPNKKLIGGPMLATTIHFGLQEMEVTCKFSNTLKETEIGLSNHIIETLHLPLGVDYELSFQNERIIIGPFIGILMNSPDSVINKNGKKLNRIIKQYPSIHGVIVAFSWEGMNPNKPDDKRFHLQPKFKEMGKSYFSLPNCDCKTNEVILRKDKLFKYYLWPSFF